MQCAQWEGVNSATVTAYVCRSCEYEIRGQEPPEPEYWPSGEWIPTIGEAGDKRKILVCGICRYAVFDSETLLPMRLASEDVVGLDIAPGCYASCPRCIAFFQPAIRERLVQCPEQAGFGPDQVHMIPAELYGDWLQ